MNRNNIATEIEFIRNNRIANEVVLIDGPVRGGKSMLGPVLGSFERVEIERMEPFFDSLPVLYSFNKITKDAAVTMLRKEIDVRLYDSMISRMINFRFKDRTSPFFNKNIFKYIKRMFFEDGNSVLERIKKEKPIFQVMTHDMLQILDLYLEAFGKGLRVIEMVRHPVDLVYSNHNRGLGTSIGKNPRFWQLAIKSEEDDIPYYASGWESEFLKETPLNRVIKIVCQLVKQVRDEYDKLPETRKKQVIIVPYEKFLISPYKYIEKIESFIDTKRTKSTAKILKKLKLPNEIDPNNRKSKLKSIEESASEECLQILFDLSKEYEDRYLKFS
ncbi:MAG: hypothetical protein CMH78_07365 [Nitrospinae bacterium]|jgi:hypothetical protein|nr:hypothetical protein [Nitrospinota bacterium]HJN01669.1 hypothetical protein [Nitrospinota bacterium]|tara:strand:+ start:6143 stop:7132 length:990 start_codon:yes stop_codon:yes gene_type:complete